MKTRPPRPGFLFSYKYLKMFKNHNNSAALDEFELKFGNIC
jgi:hypothetical protein